MSMLDQIEADTSIFFADFGQPVTFKLAGVAVATVDCLFNPSAEVASPYEAETIVSRPEVWCKTAEVSGFDHQHTLTTGGIEYRQFGEPKPEGPLTRFVLVK